MNKLLRAALCTIAGAAIIVATAIADYRASNGPWMGGFAYTGPLPDVPGLIPLVEYRPSHTETPKSSSQKILFIDFDEDDWTSLLAEGAIPTPGSREALAGVLCEADEIVVRGETYRVTGRMRRDAAGLSMVYAIPYDATVTDPLLDTVFAKEGFYDRDSRQRTPKPEAERTEGIEPLFVHNAVPMPPGLPFAELAGLALALYGAAVLQWRLVVGLHRVTGAFNGVVTAAREHPRMFRFVLSLNYSAFLYVMLAGILAPRANFAASQWVFETFSEGALKELGQAYIDGNIPLAAWETFQNNFIVQTVLMSTLPSLVIPMFGVAKTLLSLTVVGFAMAPVWSGGASAMTFHWVTIAIELQAYILVSFGICVYTHQIWRVLVNHFRGEVEEEEEEEATKLHGFRFGFEALASATMYACLALAIAAIYEAVTLIAMGASIAG